MSGPILTPSEIVMVAHHAITRRYHNLMGERLIDKTKKGRRFTWDNEIEAALAEYWYAQLKGYRWTGVRSVGSADAGNEEVRWTERPDGRLMIYPTDHNQKRYVLLDGFSPQFNVVGWAFANDAKRPCFWSLEWRAYFYPRNLLNSPDAEKRSA